MSIMKVLKLLKTLFAFRYDNNIIAEYNIQCSEDEQIFYNITSLDLQSAEDCIDGRGTPQYVQRYSLLHPSPLKTVMSLTPLECYSILLQVT